MDHAGKRFYILDCPGYADFIGDLRSAMRVSDGTIIVVSGVDGVEVQTEKAWDFAEEMGLAAAFFVNKLDRDNSDFTRTLDDIRRYLSDKAVPLFIPIGKEANFKGVIDVLNQKHICIRQMAARNSKKRIYLRT